MGRLFTWLRSLDAGERTAVAILVGCIGFVVPLAIGNVWNVVVGSLQPEMNPTKTVDYDLVAQRSMSAAAWWMVIITGISVAIGAASLFLIARTLQEARRSADAAENAVSATLKIGKQQVRAYLNVEDATAKLDSTPILLTVDATIRNSGQSPAQGVSGTARLRFVEFFTYSDGDIGQETLAQLETSFGAPAVGAGQAVTLRLTFTVFGMRPSVFQIFDGFNSRAIEVDVETGYSDVFEDRHTTTCMLGSIISSVADVRQGMGMRVSSPDA